MNNLKEVDEIFETQFDISFKNSSISQYTEYVKKQLDADFNALKDLISLFEDVLNGTLENLIDIKTILAVYNEATADKIRIVTNHLSNEFNNSNSILENEYSYLSKEVANLVEAARTYLNFHNHHKEDLKLYVDYNTIKHQIKNKLTFPQYKDIKNK